MSFSVPSQQFRNHSIPIDILDELAARFIIPMREEERRDLVRVCFLIEQAHWFYIDFYVNESKYKLAQSNMKEFAAHIFQHIPFLRQHADRVDEIVDEWKEYKLAVPTYGAIILNSFMDKVLLVQGFWAKASWGFPKGKVNEDEPPNLCAVREVLEETGFDISSYLEEDEWLEQNINDHTVRLYLIPGVPENTQFQTITRCEIKDIRWFDINSLPTNKTDLTCKAKLGLAPNSFFMVVPFLRDLKQWVKLKQADRLMYQYRQLADHSDQTQRTRRVSDREDFNSPNSRQRRDSERVTGAAKISLKKSLSRPESKQERISPAKTPQPTSGQKTSRKQLFSVDSPVREESNSNTLNGDEKSDKRRKKKSSSAEPTTPVRREDVLPELSAAARTQPLFPVSFLPTAWHEFQLDKELLMKLACNSIYD